MSDIAKYAKKLLHVTQGGSSIKRPVVTGEEIKTILDSYHIAYTQCEYTESTDITTCFNEDDSYTGNHLLDILTQTSEFKKSVSETVYQSVMDVIKKNTRVSNCIETGEQRFYYDSISDIFIISKNIHDK